MTKDTAYFSKQASFYDLSVHLHTSRNPARQRGPMAYIATWQQYAGLPCSTLLVDKVPDDELAVYLLFGELVGRGFLPGYKVLYLSGGAVYDAALTFEVDLSKPSNLNTSARGGTNEFGVGAGIVQQRGTNAIYRWSNPSTGQTHLVCECKVSAEELLRDIQKRRSEKQMQDINLLICLTFDAATINNLQGAMVPVPDTARDFSGVTHRLSFAGHTVNVICLQHVIQRLTTARKL